MRNAKKIILTAALVAVSAGCSIKLGPEPVTAFQNGGDGRVRTGAITETMTGNWAALPNRVGFKNSFLAALSKPEVAPFFSGGVSSLVMDVHLTSDHLDDEARLTSLGALSMVTIGIIPLKYHSEWNVQCQVTLKNSGGAQSAVYHFNEKGTYDIWAFPLTMFSLFGAGIRGEGDGNEIFKRVSENLVDKIIQAIEADSGALASQTSGGAEAGAFPALQKNAII